MKNSYTYSDNACVFKKFYGDIHVIVVLESAQDNIEKSGVKDAVNALKDDIWNLLNDNELERLFNS